MLALDPISTLAVEDLINELKGDYTIVIVTHNMQQAARIADYTAFFNLKAVGEPGHLEYFADTTTMFNNPRTPKPSATSPVVSADRRRAGGSHALHPPARPSPQDPASARGLRVCEGELRNRRSDGDAGQLPCCAILQMLYNDILDCHAPLHPRTFALFPVIA